MNKILLALLIFISSCGYQPIYINKNQVKFEYSEFDLKGNEDINKKIINLLQISKNEKKNKLYIVSNYNVEVVSKDSSGQTVSFKTIIDVDLEIRDSKNTILKNKNFVKELTYDNKSNNFKLVDYQEKIKNDLINTIISDIIIFLSS